MTQPIQIRRQQHFPVEEALLGGSILQHMKLVLRTPERSAPGFWARLLSALQEEWMR